MNQDNKEEVIVEFYTMAMTLSDYTMYEQRTMMRIIEYCQADIREAITQQCKDDKMLRFSPAEVSEQKRRTRIPLCRLENSPSHYSRLRLALSSMARKRVSIPFRSNGNRLEYKSFDSLFSVEFSPAGRKPYVELQTPLQVLRYYLSIGCGYHHLNLKRYFSFVHYPTRQMYRLYYALLARCSHHMRPDFLVKFLSAQGHYNSYASLKKNLLEVARREMEEAYRQGRCELYFSYIPQWAGQDDRCLYPKHVAFQIMTDHDAHPDESQKAQLKAFQHQVSLQLKLRWRVDENQAVFLCQRIKHTMMAEIDSLFYRSEWFVKDMERRGKPIRNLGGYMRTRLHELLLRLEGEHGSEGFNEHEFHE